MIAHFALLIVSRPQTPGAVVQYPAPRTLSRERDFGIDKGPPLTTSGPGGRVKRTAAEIHALTNEDDVIQPKPGEPPIVRASPPPDWILKATQGRNLLQVTDDTLTGSERIIRTNFRVDLEGNLIFFRVNLFSSQTETGTIEICRGLTTRSGNSNLIYARGLRLSYVFHRSGFFGKSHSSVRDFRDVDTNDLQIAAYGYKDETSVTVPTPTAKDSATTLNTLENLVLAKYREMEKDQKLDLIELISVTYPVKKAQKLEALFRSNS